MSLAQRKPTGILAALRHVGFTPLVRSVVSAAYHRRTLVCAGILCLTLASVAGVTRLSFDTDVLSLLPQDGRAIPGFREFLAKFGNLDQLFVVFTAPEGQSIEDYADDVDAWVEQLRAGAGDRARRSHRRRSIARSQLACRAPACSCSSDRSLDEALARLTPDGLAKAVALEARAADAAVQRDRSARSTGPGGISELALDPWAAARTAWRAIGDRRPSTSPRTDASGSSSRIRCGRHSTPISRERSTLDFEGIQSSLSRPTAPVTFAGGHRIAVETEALVRREAIVNTVASLVTIMPLLLVVFRSLWLVVVGSLPSALSLLVVLGVMGFSGVTLSAAAAGSAAMLFGLGIDGVVLLYVAHRLALAEGQTPESAVASSAGPSTSMLLGMWTTAATFYGLAVVDFPSLQQLGALIGHSMLVCGLLTLVLVPALLSHRAPRRSIRPLDDAGAGGLDRSTPPPVLAGSVVVTLIARRRRARAPNQPDARPAPIGHQRRPARGEYRRRFQSSRVTSTSRWRRAPTSSVCSKRTSALSSACRRFRGLCGSSLPPGCCRPLPRRRGESERIQRSGLTPAAVTASLSTRRRSPDSDKGAFEPFVERLPALLDTSSGSRYQAFETQGLDDLVGRFVRRDDDGVDPGDLSCSRQTTIRSRAVQDVVDSAGSGHVLTGLPLVNREMAATFGPQFVKGLGHRLDHRRGADRRRRFAASRLSILALLPTVVGLLWTAGLLALASVELDLFALFAVVTFVGIGVDYGIHVVHRSQERHAPSRAIAELAPIILVAGAITLLRLRHAHVLVVPAPAFDRAHVRRQRSVPWSPHRCWSCLRSSSATGAEACVRRP